MIEIQSDSTRSELAVSISGTLTHDDYEKLRPELELRADSEGHFNMLVELADVSGLEASAIKDDLVFAKDFKDSIDRLAIVTQDDVFSTVAEFVGSPLGEVLGVEVKRFDEPDVAWTWIRGSGSN